jgi:plastocyanin
MKRRFRVIAAAAAAVSLGMFACGGDDDGDATAHTCVAKNTGCDASTADDLTGSSAVALSWSNPHDCCILVASGTAVSWQGSFSAHPLAGGTPGSKDASSSITGSDQSGDSATVTFSSAGSFPYFCEIHTSSMAGTVIVQ